MALSYYDPTANIDTDTATEIANLRDDCTAAHEMIEVQRQRIAQLESDVTAESEYAARYAMDLHRAEIRGNTYRCRALALVRQVDEERIWATFYQSEVERLQTELNALRGRIEASLIMAKAYRARIDEWADAPGDGLMRLDTVDGWLCDVAYELTEHDGEAAR